MVQRVNQPHPTKIVSIRAFFVLEINFMKKSKIPILVSDSAHKSLLIILQTFFDLTEIRKITLHREKWIIKFNIQVQ